MKSLRCPTRSSARSRNWLPPPPSIPRQGPSLNILAAIVFANCPPIHRSERSPPTPPFPPSFRPKKPSIFGDVDGPVFFFLSATLLLPLPPMEPSYLFRLANYQTKERTAFRPLFPSSLWLLPSPPPFVGVGARFCFALLGRPKTRLQPLPSSPAMATFCRPRPPAKIGRHHKSV